MPNMVADRGWVEGELRGVCVDFECAAAYASELAQVQHAIQEDTRTRPDLCSTAKEIADTVVVAKSDIDQTMAVFAESVKNKEVETTQIVQ